MITVTEAARRLGCSVAIIRRMCADGRISAKKYGKTWLIDRLEFERIVVKPRKSAHQLEREEWEKEKWNREKAEWEETEFPSEG